ncbi:MAG: DUF5684 domain-containing protein, partial [Bacilli bacterium]
MYQNYETTTSYGMFGAGFASMLIIPMIISFIISILIIISYWKLLKRAGKNGWEILIPIYNVYILLQIAEKPVYYLALFIVPFVNIYALFTMNIALANKFGKTTGFGVGMTFLPFIFIPILAFGKNNGFEQSASEAPVVEQPAYEAPVVEQPAYEAPVVEQPVYEAPVV